MQREQLSEPRHPAHFSAVLPRWKRTIDVICCIAALPLLGLIAFVFAIISATVAKGPVFFRQENIGRTGQRFALFRFRTMRMKSFAPVEPASRGTPELIPGGRFLRASGLAELPQIVNVLRGEMSMVGSRAVRENESVSAAPPGRSAMPGLTGLWRVAQRNGSNADETAQLDNIYAERKSPWLDIKIILQTIPLLCAAAMDAWKSKSAGNRLRRNAAAESASLRAPTEQPW